MLYQKLMINKIHPHTIGLLILIAITVLLTVIIAGFLFAMVGSAVESKDVIIFAHQNSNDIVFTVVGGRDLSSVDNITYTVDGANGESNLVNATKSGSSFATGSTTTITGISNIGKNHVMAVGHFKDGIDQIILDTYL